MQKFTKLHRLNGADEFSSVFLFRKARFGNYLKIYYKPNDYNYNRLGLIVSKKIHKRANKRNYMKRVLRELFRHDMQSLTGYDLIIRVQKYFTKDDFITIKNEFLHLTEIFGKNIKSRI